MSRVDAGRRSFRVARWRTVPGSFAVRSVAEYTDEDGEPDADELILVDGWQIGSTYRCADGTWASWGPAGLDMRHPTRRAAIDVQVRAYAVHPSGFDRLVANDLAEQQAEHARREEQKVTARRALAEARRRERRGDDEPGPTIWALPAYHVLYADPAETQQVAVWLEEQGIDDVSAVHEIRVEQRAHRRVVVFERPEGRLPTSRDARTELHVVTLTAEPPPITAAARPDLHALLDLHWPTRFPLVDNGRSMTCPVCSRSWRDLEPGEALIDGFVVWPCPPVATAIANPRPATGLLDGHADAIDSLAPRSGAGPR